VTKNILIFRYQDALVQAGAGDDEAVERIARPGDFHGPAEGGIEILIADREADPVRQIGHDSVGVDCDLLHFVQKLQLQLDDR
jgi:hypothetical protein